MELSKVSRPISFKSKRKETLPNQSATWYLSLTVCQYKVIVKELELFQGINICNIELYIVSFKEIRYKIQCDCVFNGATWDIQSIILLINSLYYSLFNNAIFIEKKDNSLL